MYNVSKDFNENIHRFDRKINIKLSVNGEAVGKENIIKATIERGVADGTSFTIGQTYSSKIEVELYKCDIDFKQGDRIDLSLLLEADKYQLEEPEEVPQGVYYVDKAEINGVKVKLTAFDKFYNMNEEYDTELIYPTTSRMIMEEIASKYGFKHDTTLEDITIVEKLVGYSIKEIIGFIAGIQGKNAIINTNNEISFVDFTRVNYKLDPSSYITFSKESDCKITGVTCLFGDIGIDRGDMNGNVLAFKNPWCKEEDLDRIFNKYRELTLVGANIRYIGNFGLLPSDIIQIEDKEGSIHNLFISKHTISYSGGITGEIVSGCENKSDTNHFINKVASKKTLTELTIEQGKIKAEITEVHKEVESTTEKVAKLEITADKISQSVSNTENKIVIIENTISDKAKVFTRIPTPPYKEGDLWLKNGGITVKAGGLTVSEALRVSGAVGDMFVCTTDREEGEFNSNDWKKATKYTDDSYAIKVESKLEQTEKDIIATFTETHKNGYEEGVVKMTKDGIEVKHSGIKTSTWLKADGNYIVDENGETIASLSSKESWTEIKADKFFGENILNVYTGERNLYVDHNSKNTKRTGSSEYPFTSFSQLRRHLESAPIINKTIYINILTNSTVKEQFVLRGLSGSGWIHITFNKNFILLCDDSFTRAIDFSGIDNRVIINGGRMSYNSNDGAYITGKTTGAYFTDCKYIKIADICFNMSSYGVVFANSNGKTEHIDFCDTPQAIGCSEGGKVYDESSCGNCKFSYVALTGGIITYGGEGNGYKPKGAISEYSGKVFEVQPRTATGSFVTPPVTPVYTKVESFKFTSFATYQYKWNNWSIGECKQGIYQNYGNKAGHIFFDTKEIREFLQGSTLLDDNIIIIKRRNGGGYSSKTAIYINGSTSSGASGTPVYSNNTYLGELAWGELGMFTLPKSIAQGINNGSINSIALYSPNGKDYFEAVDCYITIKCQSQ